MSNLLRRIERLEKLGQKHEQRFIYILPNLEEKEYEETPYKMKVSPDLWAHAMAGGAVYQ